MIVQEQIQQLNLINDSFKPSEARDIANAIIDNQINVYKLQKNRRKGISLSTQEVFSLPFNETRLKLEKMMLRDFFKYKDHLVSIKQCYFIIQAAINIQRVFRGYMMRKYYFIRVYFN